MVRKLLTAFAVSLGLFSSTPVMAQEVVEYYALDQVGSVRVVFDQNGTITSRRDYGPFGEALTPVTADPKVYAGLFRDDESTLDYAQARSYQSRTGRFHAVDPVYAGLFNPQRLNRYAYALNSPLAFVDPTGLTACEGVWNPESQNWDFTGCSNEPVEAEGSSTQEFFWRADWCFFLNGCGGTSEGGGGVSTASGSRSVITNTDQGTGSANDSTPAVITAGVPVVVVKELLAAAFRRLGWRALLGVPAAQHWARSLQNPRVAKLTQMAREMYPGKAGRFETHHIWPQYLGGPNSGPTWRIDAAYHQLITNAFREAWPYGGVPPSPQRAQQIIVNVYKKYPIW
jgi:RHS repeat-associated protein